VCIGKTPKIPAPPAPPPPPQETKAPDMNSVRRKRSESGGIPGGTLLTGPSGVDSGMLSTGGGSLLGG
jgi:hypothetical protein